MREEFPYIVVFIMFIILAIMTMIAFTSVASNNQCRGHMKAIENTLVED